MSNYRPIDSKREEFRKYLERAGVMDALTRVLVGLYEEAEKPADALDYVRKNLGDNRPDVAEFEAVKEELEASKAKLQAAEDENASLKERLKKYEPSEGEAAPDAASTAEPAAEQPAEPADDAPASPTDAEAAPPEETQS